jgi:pyruvate kinase
MDRRTKIVATIGPACQDEITLQQLIQAGVNVARLNFSHGSHEDHATAITRLRNIANNMGRAICILQDLQGPKIRTGELAAGQVMLSPGQILTLTTQPLLGDEHTVSVDYPDLPRCVKPGGRILLDDGNLELSVVGIEGDRVETRVTLGGMLKPHKGVNLPGAKLDIPSFTEKDENDLAFGLEHGVDVVAISFVRSANDVRQVRQAIARLAPERTDTPIIAKLERPEALDNLEQIMEVTDGVMVARGDLGVEMLPEIVPIAQKRIIECANRHARLVITATQMLDSMIHNPRPTRAEASDVANAIFDGTDAVMLSGETAVGEYPIKAVQMMDSIARQAEEHSAEWGHYHEQPVLKNSEDDAYFVALATRELAHDRNVEAIAVFTRTGRTAAIMAKVRPNVPILAFTPEVRVYQRLEMFWGVKPYLVPHAATIEGMVADVEAVIRQETPLQPGQQFVLVCGFPVNTVSPANLALLHTVGQ